MLSSSGLVAIKIGLLSSSFADIVWVYIKLSPKKALVGLDNVIIIVSSSSARSSSMMLGIVIVPVFSPAFIVKVPFSKL